MKEELYFDMFVQCLLVKPGQEFRVTLKSRQYLPGKLVCDSE